MTQEEFIKDVIKETLYQVQEQGWDLLDTIDSDINKGIRMVYDRIKKEYLWEE